MANVTISGNGQITGTATQEGGGIYLERETNLDAMNCLIFGNSAENGGGGVFIDPDLALGSAPDFHTFTNCTITQNTVMTIPGGTNGAGIQMDASGTPDPGNPLPSVHIDNSIVWGNFVGVDIFRVNGGLDMYVDYCDVGSASGNILIRNGFPPPGIDPQFINPAGGNFRLSATPPSLCIDRASFSLLPKDPADLNENTIFNEVLPKDLDLLPRAWPDAVWPALPLVDMGAYEVHTVVP